MSFSKKILSKAKNVKVLLMDVDGVLTKGEMIIIGKNDEIKIWDIKDRFAYTMLRKSGLGIKIGWISGRGSKELQLRAKDLKLDFFYQWVKDKLEVFNEIIKIAKVTPKEVCYIGDDWLDIPVLKRVGLAVCPKDAVKEVKKIVHYICSAKGGCGVFREIVELILIANNVFDKVFSLYDK